MRAAAFFLLAALCLAMPARAQPVESPEAWQVLWGEMLAAERAGEFAAALEMADRLLPAATSGWGPDTEQALEARARRAHLLSRVGEYRAAREEGQRAYEGFLRVLGPGHGRTQTEAMSFAVRLSEAGEVALAVPLALEAIAGAEANLPASDPQLNIWRYNLGGFLQDMGRLAEADAIYARVAEALAQAPSSPRVLHYRATMLAQWARLGDAMGQGEAAAARGREAIALAEAQFGPVHPDTLRAMRDQALRLYKAGATLEAHDLTQITLSRTIETYGTRNLKYAQTLQLRALLRCRSQVGTELFAKGLADQRAVVALLGEILPDNHPELGMALLELAALLRVAGEPLEALETALAAEKARAPSRKLLIEMVDNALTRGAISGERAEREMFRVAQGFLASKAGIALRQSAYRRALGDEGAVAYRALTDAERQEQQLHAALADMAGRPKVQRDAGAEAALRARISATAREIAGLKAAVEGQVPQMSALLGTDVLEVEEVQALLGPTEALVLMDYSARPGDPHVIHAITREQAIYVPIYVKAEALAAAVADLRGSIDLRLGMRAATSLKAPEGGAPPKDFHLPAAHWLYKMSFAPIEHALAGKNHLFVLQRGAMASLPPQLLVRNAPERLEQADWLVRHVAITVIPSVAALRGVGQRPEGGSRAPILAFSNPEFGGALLPLPETTGEASAVARAVGGSGAGLKDGAGASEAAVKGAALSGYRTLYFATHGLMAGDVVAGRALEEPALALTGGGGEDGLLTASEIASLTLDADLVVLSACNTARGEGADGEALSGLAQAFTYAGARGLLVSHWPVESQSAVALMTDIFARRAEDPGLSAAQAQRRAILAMIDGPKAEWRHPAYWAPFILVGDPDR